MDDHQEKKDGLFEIHRENIYFRWGLTAVIVIVVCIIAAQFITKMPAFFGYVKAFLGTLSPVLYGLGIAYLLHPIEDRIRKLLEPQLRKVLSEKKAAGMAKGIGIFASLVFAGLVIWALIAMILPQLLESITTIIGNFPSYYNTLTKWVQEFINGSIAEDVTQEIMDQVYIYLKDFLTGTVLPKVQTILAGLTTSIVNIAKSMLNLIIGVIISIYLLSGKDKFLAQSKKLCYAVLGHKRGGYVCNVCTFANRVFGGFIGGKIIDSLIIGILCFIGLQILDMPYTMLISIIVGVTNIIPFFGPYLGAIPSALLLLVIDPMECLYFVIFIIILQQLDGNVIGPQILGDATGLDSIWVVVSLLIFGNLFGILGMVIAVPLFAVIYKIVSELVNFLLKKRELSTTTSDYTAWNYPPRKDFQKWNPTSKHQKKRAQRKHQRFLARQGRVSAETAPPEDANGDENSQDHP